MWRRIWMGLVGKNENNKTGIGCDPEKEEVKARIRVLAEWRKLHPNEVTVREEDEALASTLIYGAGVERK